MNCPSRPDNIEDHPDWNQNPTALSSDVTTRADLNGIVNLREQGLEDSIVDQSTEKQLRKAHRTEMDPKISMEPPELNVAMPLGLRFPTKSSTKEHATQSLEHQSQNGTGLPSWINNGWKEVGRIMTKYAQFVGPGFLIAVAYIDPGNYATDVQAGAATRYKHLFIVLMSNLFAIFLQSLCIKLGSVTGLNLAENCRKHFPRWLTILLYLFAESAIIATDVAEVIGSAIALNLLLRIPLVAGCVLTMVDVLLLLLFYRPDGSMTRLRLFEYFVMALVLGVVICFCIQLSYIRDSSPGEVFSGYLPSSAIVRDNGIYLSCGILGATVMPHSIFLGSGIVQPRLKHFDVQNGHHIATNDIGEEEKYRPSITAIRSCLKYSIAELATSLFTFALFVNSAILIVAGSSLYSLKNATDAGLYSIHDLLSQNLSRVAGTIFALALLLSSTSAGIICTMAGQMVSEGMLNWTVKPWMRRLITRSISIIPSIIIAATIGKKGLSQALTASQVVLSVILPFVTAPLLWFTCRSKVMSVRADDRGRRGSEGQLINMRNGWVVTILAIVIWLVLVVMNVALLVSIGLGKA